MSHTWSDLDNDPTDSTRRTKWVVLGLLLVFGAVIRVHGFTRYDLWFDDAWAASAARVGIGQAIHMLLTAPGYGLAQRFWIRLDPLTTWWAQIPNFVLGLAAIPAIWWSVRRLHFSRWYAIGAAVFITVTPTAVMYSTRVKEYPMDLLLACVLVTLTDRVRRAPRRSLVPLAVASSLAIFISASCAVVVVGLWLATIGIYLRDRGSWRRWFIAAGATAVAAMAVWAVFFRSVPKVLSHNWMNRGYLADYANVTQFKRTMIKMFGGFAHTTLGFPVPTNFYRSVVERSAYPATIVGVAVMGTLIAVPVVRAWRHRRVGVALPSALVLVTALAMALVGRVPFGDGRTDEVLYPAMIVCACVVVRSSVHTITRRRAILPPVAAAVGSVLAALALLFGALHPAHYPSVNLRGLSAQLAANERPGDVVIVETFNSFGWCYYQLSACTIQVGGHPLWPQGFRPVFTETNVMTPAKYAGPYPDVRVAVDRATRVWYVGFTFGTFDVNSPQWHNVPVLTGTRVTLSRAGWHVASPVGPNSVLKSTNAFAYLLIK